MTPTERARGGPGFTAAVALAAALIAGGSACSTALSTSRHEAAASCRGSTVELDFDPEGRIEARAGGKTVASGDVVSRSVSYGACTKRRMPSGFSQGGVRYAQLRSRVTLTCRFPGRFMVVVYPVSPSWAGERPAGTNVGLVVGRRLRPGPGPQRTILASATVLTRSHESSLVFVRPYCRPTTSR